MDFTKTNLIISSREPEKLGKFYSSIMGLELSGGFGLMDFCLRNRNPQKINFYKPSNKHTKARFCPPTLALCFEGYPVQDPINVIKGCIEKIISFGGELIEGPITEGFGVEAWFSDIEDNYFLVVIPLLQVDKK